MHRELRAIANVVGLVLLLVAPSAAAQPTPEPAQPSNSARTLVNVGAGLLIVGGLADLTIAAIDVHSNNSTYAGGPGSGVQAADVALLTSGVMFIITGAVFSVILDASPPAAPPRARPARAARGARARDWALLRF